MPRVVGISLRSAGKIIYYQAGDERYHPGERVLVETAHGPELGTVKLPPHEIDEEKLSPPFPRVLRRATAGDITRDAANREREEHALDVCNQLIGKLSLPMRLINAEYNFDGSHVLIHFLAENRVDFRELVRELAKQLRTRIELRQVGVRDEAKLIGGYGICGRSLCCTTFLANFSPVAINVAKAQGLALNPQKISGTCGRLMCCLAYEYEHYRESHVDMPRVNARVETPRGPGKITKLNVLSRQVEVTLPDESSPVWFSVDELNGDAIPACPAEGGCGACCAQHTLGEESTEVSVAVEEQPARSAARRRRSAPPARLAPSPETAAETAEKSTRKRRPRHRNKTNANAPEQSAAAPRAESAPAQDAPAAQRRRRRRKPAPTAVNTPATPAPTPPVSGQYTPRKRRRR